MDVLRKWERYAIVKTEKGKPEAAYPQKFVTKLYSLAVTIRSSGGYFLFPLNIW